MSDSGRPSSGSSNIAGIARHGRLRKAGPWGAVITFLAAAIAVVVVSTLTIGSITALTLVHNVKTADIHPGESPAPPPGIGVYPGGFNILVVGDDTRAGQGGIGGSAANDSGALNDVTILLHVSGDHTWATAVSFPRDMVVPHPQCSIGGTSAGLPINTALSYGGLPCVVTTVEALTGLPIQFAGLITFDGVVEMTNAVGGVPVCVSGNLNDKEVGLHLTSGMHTLSGLTALEFLRSRHGVGDGSDLGRISSQQVYMSSLVRTLESDGTLSNLGTLFKIATAATQNMELSSSLASPDTMIAIAQALKNIPVSNIQFVQYPGTTGEGGIYSGKVAPIPGLANQLFSLIRADKPFKLGTEGNNRGSVVSKTAYPTATPIPGATSTSAPTTTTGGAAATVLNGLVGQSAAQYTCSKANTQNGEG
jgi:LCP family protein required for cell wall assembly